MIGPAVQTRVDEILDRGLDEAHGELLVRSLPLNYENGKRLLQALRQGLRENVKIEATI